MSPILFCYFNSDFNALGTKKSLAFHIKIRLKNKKVLSLQFIAQIEAKNVLKQLF